MHVDISAFQGAAGLCWTSTRPFIRVLHVHLAVPSTCSAELLTKVSQMEFTHLGLRLLILLRAHLWDKAPVSLGTI